MPVDVVLETQLYTDPAGPPTLTAHVWTIYEPEGKSQVSQVAIYRLD